MRVRFRSRPASVAALVCLALGAGAADAQTTTSGAAFENQFPDPVTYRPPVPDPPELQFLEIYEIPLPGPILGPPRLAGDRIEVPTGTGWVRSGWAEGDEPAAAGSADSEAVRWAEWASSPDGSHRALPAEGRLIVQKACPGCNSGWRRRWRLRVPGLAPVPPVMTERRVYYGTAENRVYGVKRKNGHRLWATALDGRVLRPLALWVEPDAAEPIAAILAVPDPGRDLVVLDALGGRPMLRYGLAGEEDRVIGAPLATPDGHVILARQGYTVEDAGLIVLRLGKSPETGGSEEESGPTGYNPPTSKEGVPVESDPQAPAAPAAPAGGKAAQADRR